MDSQSASVCVISLDALDLNFLKDCFEKNFGTPSSWTKRDLYISDKLYYEFEIKEDECLDIQEDAINHQEEIEYIPCHICEIEVPQQFYYEHKNSVKHEINIKIANVAVQRLQKYVNYHYECNSKTKKSSIYFCPVCVIAMDSVEKINHEDSIGHKNSVIVERFLKDFLSIYSNQAYQDDENSKYKVPTTVTTENRSTVKTIGSNVENKSKKISENKKSTEATSLTKRINENKLNNVMRFEDYITILKEKYKCQATQFKVINEYTIEITTIDGSIARVSAESFHGFKEMPTRFTRCIICKEIFDKSSVYEHILTEYHMKLVCWPLRNKDCIRNISDWYHCVLCNMRAEDSTSHVTNTKHLENIELFVISDNNEILDSQLSNVHSSKTIQIKNKNENSFENANNMSLNDSTDVKADKMQVLATQNMENITTDVIKLKSEQSKVESIHEKQFCSCCNTFISNKGFRKHSSTVKHYMNTLSDYHYFMNANASSDTGDFVCRICEENVSNNVEDVKQHTKLSNHLQIYNTLLENNGVRQINEQTLFCTPCNDIILIKNELFHINSREHKMLCGDNNETLDNILSTVPSPVEAETSETKGETASSYFFCNICSVKVPNGKQNIEIHIKGRPHLKNMQKLFNRNVNSEELGEKEPKKGNNNVVDVNKDQINDATPKSQTETPVIRHNIVKTHDLSILKCIVCEVFITNNDANIATHLKGLNHTNSYNMIVERNGLEVNDNDVFCKICSVHISIGNEINHCKGKKHINNLSTTESS